MRIKLTVDDNFTKYQKWLKKCQKSEIENMKDRIGMRIAMKGLQNVKAITPARTGRLKQSLTMGATENYFKLKVDGNTTVVIYGTTVPYAKAVEYGYDQKNRVNKKTGNKPSLYVPGYWSSGTFHYDPKSDTGMLLTGRIIEGAHMFQNSMDATREDAKTEILKEFRRLYGALF